MVWIVLFLLNFGSNAFATPPERFRAPEEAVIESQLRALRDRYISFLELLSPSLPASDVVKTCALVIYGEWETAYESALYKTPVNLNLLVPELRKHARFLGDLETSSKQINEARPGILDLLAAELRSRRSTGAWPSGGDSLSLTFNETLGPLLIENLHACARPGF